MYSPLYDCRNLACDNAVRSARTYCEKCLDSARRFRDTINVSEAEAVALMQEYAA